MPHNNRMKISAKAYADLKSDLRDLIISVRDKGDPMEQALLSRQIEDVEKNGHVSALFKAIWVNTDFDDSHPRFHDGETEIIDRDTGKTRRAIRFAATRHLPFKDEDNRWVHRLQARSSDGGEDLTDDQIATAIKEIVRDLGAEIELSPEPEAPGPDSDDFDLPPEPDTLVIVSYDFDLDDEDENDAARPDQVPLLGQQPFHMDGNQAHYRFPATMGVDENVVDDDLEHNSPWSHFGFTIGTTAAPEPAAAPVMGANDASYDDLARSIENRSINSNFLDMAEAPEGQGDAYRKAWMAEAERRDDAWQKLLVERFGDEAATARYDKRGRGAFGEPLGEAFLHRQYAILRAFPEDTFPKEAAQPLPPHDGRFEFTGESRQYDGVIGGEKVSETVWRIRATADFGSVKCGEIGGWIVATNNIEDDGWVEGDGIILAGTTVGHAARVKGSEFGKSVIHKSQIAGKAEVDDSVIAAKSVVTDSARVKNSHLNNAHMAGRSISFSSTIRGSLVENTNVEGSTVDFTYASNSRILTTRMEADSQTGQGFRVRDSNLDNVNITVGSDPERTADLRIERASLTDVDLQGQDCIGVTIDASPLGERLIVDAALSPRAASAWLHHRASDDQAQEHTDPLEHPIVFLPDLPTTQPANENTLRAVLIAGLRSKDPEITRYLNTVAAPDDDYGVVEAIMEDSRLRMALTDALRQIPASLIGDRFVREPEDSRLQIGMVELDNRMLDAQIHMSQLPGIRTPLRLYQNSLPRRIPDGTGASFSGVPIILLHGTMENDARSAVYEPAFVQTGMPDDDFSSATIRTFTADGAVQPKVAFAEEQDAQAFIADYLKRGMQAVAESKGEVLPNAKAPIITDFRGEGDRAIFLMKAAPDAQTGHKPAPHDGYQAAMVNLAAFCQGKETLHPSAFDGALASSGAALRVAQARAERGYGWERREAPKSADHLTHIPSTTHTSSGPSR